MFTWRQWVFIIIPYVLVCAALPVFIACIAAHYP